MKQTDKIFIENNICSIHDGIINSLIKIEDGLIEKEQMEFVPVLEELVLQTQLAKEKATKIEQRLKTYLYTIRALGFSRDKEMEEIHVVDNKLTLTARLEAMDSE